MVGKDRSVRSLLPRRNGGSECIFDQADQSYRRPEISPTLSSYGWTDVIASFRRSSRGTNENRPL